MKTEFVDFSSNKLIEALHNDEVIAFPTETVYGLGCIYDLKKAYDRLVEIKKRPPNKPFTLMGGRDFDFNDFAYLDDNILKVIKKYVPGPITLLLKAKENLPYQVSLNTSKIGIRISSNKLLEDFIYRVGKPLLVPSANISSFPPLVTEKEVYDVFKNQIPYIVKSSFTPSKPSTIVDLSIPNEISLIRQGELNFEDIKRTFKGE